MVGSRSFDHNFRPLLRTWPLGVFGDIANSLLYKRFLARRCGLAEFLFAPLQNLTNNLPSGGGEAGRVETLLSDKFPLGGYLGGDFLSDLVNEGIEVIRGCKLDPFAAVELIEACLGRGTLREVF